MTTFSKHSLRLVCLLPALFLIHWESKWRSINWNHVATAADRWYQAYCRWILYGGASDFLTFDSVTQGVRDFLTNGWDVKSTRMTGQIYSRREAEIRSELLRDDIVSEDVDISDKNEIENDISNDGTALIAEIERIRKTIGGSIDRRKSSNRIQKGHFTGDNNVLNIIEPTVNDELADDLLYDPEFLAGLAERTPDVQQHNIGTNESPIHSNPNFAPLFAHAGGARPQCLTAEAMIGGMRQYLVDWDRQLIEASNSSWTCEQFAIYMFASRDRIQSELTYTYGNMTTVPQTEPERWENGTIKEEAELDAVEAKIPRGFGELPWIMSHVNKAASLVSASVHVNSGLGVIRSECFIDPAVHLLFFVSLRRVHQLSLNQLKYLWYMMQNTPEMYRGASSQWLLEAAQVFRGDLDTTESIFTGWNPPNLTIANRTNTDIEQTHYNKWQRPKVLTIVELLRRITFDTIKWDRELTRILMRHGIFEKNDLVLELGAGSGEISKWLNETGWVQSHAYDYSDDIELITFSSVHNLDRGQKPPLLGDGDIPYDWLLCVSEQCPNMIGDIGEELSILYITKGIILDRKIIDEIHLTKGPNSSKAKELQELEGKDALVDGKDIDGDWLLDLTFAKYGGEFYLDEATTELLQDKGLEAGRYQVWRKRGEEKTKRGEEKRTEL